MAPTRPDYKINLDGLGTISPIQMRSPSASAANSPLEGPAGSGYRYPQSTGGLQSVSGRLGTASPSKEYPTSRIFSKRAREIQQQEGVAPPLWGPPITSSGHSTPLRETIPESPSSDIFPDFESGQPGTGSHVANAGLSRRTRAGTMPSRFSPVGSSNSVQPSLFTANDRTSPSPSRFPTSSTGEARGSPGSSTANSALLSRLRAGSMPQKAPALSNQGPFGSSLFGGNWTPGRDRASTLQSIRSSDGPSSPRQSITDIDVRTLDYLGLADTPHQRQPSESLSALLDQIHVDGPSLGNSAALHALNSKATANRFRSYSVNAKEKYADGEDIDQLDSQHEHLQRMYGQVTPAESTAAQAAAIQEAVRRHNLEVQAFANFASANRPRARTAGVLDAPPSRLGNRQYMPTPSRLENSLTVSDLQSNDGSDINAVDALQMLQLNNPQYDLSGDPNTEQPTRSLWLGNIPPSTTVSSLNVIFSRFGPIESSRVLTHKSCGFVNFENVESAIAAKASFNGCEIFPGCGPVRVGYAKEQNGPNKISSLRAGNGLLDDQTVSESQFTVDEKDPPSSINAQTAAAALAAPNVLSRRDELVFIVEQFGTHSSEMQQVTDELDNALSSNNYFDSLPASPEVAYGRTHDAPKLREIRKRIDNNSYSQSELEAIAIDMLDEIAELSSDYLGNTVVQKLFEHCSEHVKEQMLVHIAPRLAEIGMHKNGTWAAQKIINVAQTQSQQDMIVNALRPHAISLFLDQFGNYVIQCCLRFQAPTNNFIFDAMVSNLWEIAQGRFGARAMRACLESHFATNNQKRIVTASIALHVVQLATNANGALVLTWLLDTCTFPNRRAVLAPRLITHLVHLCTHKVAYLTVLKIVNQRHEPEARDALLNALFFNEPTLRDIVSDQACGAALIFKVLTTPFLDDEMRSECAQRVRDTLTALRVQPTAGYKRLMEEVGLSTRGNGPHMTPEIRTPSRVSAKAAYQQHFDPMPDMYGRPSHIAPGLHDPRNQSTVSMDSGPFDPHLAHYMSPQYPHSPAMTAVGLSPSIQQAQFQQQQQQQHMLAHAQQQILRSNAYMGGPGGLSPHLQGYSYGQVMGGPQLGQYRQSVAGSPLLSGGFGHFPQQSFAMPQGSYEQQLHELPHYQQGQSDNRRRGRANGS